MAQYLSLARVSEAVFAALAGDATLATLLSATGVVDDVPQDPAFPFLWVEADETQPWGGFGTKPGRRALPEVRIRMHVYSQFQGMAQAQAALARAIAVLADPPTVTGYDSWAIFHDRTIVLPDEELRGVKVKELVSEHRLYVEEQ